LRKFAMGVSVWENQKNLESGAPGLFEQGRDLVYVSGQWQIDLGRRELLSNGVAVPIGTRAFEIVEVLVQSASELVTKNDIMDRIWPGGMVGENTLQVHVSAIRKALGPDRAMLNTASGQGYRLLGNWKLRQRGSATAPAASPLTPEPGAPPANNFPVIAGRLIGRDAAARHVRDLVSAYRVVTLTGTGGIGKTSLAIAVAHGVVGNYADGGWLVELASLSDPALVSTAVAGALRVPTGLTNVSPETIARSIGTKKLLLVLDNCEHLIEAVATLADTLLAHCPYTTIIATSRETLRIQGEHVYRVPPLEVPAAGLDVAEHILNSSAVELFITRTKASGASFSLSASELPSIGAICRHLDGIPLAIEFAAARASTFGIQPVLAHLHDRFALLTTGRRTALPRHRTLRAVLDWSYEFLPEAEQRLLRHLSIFSGGFTVEAAAAVVNDDGSDPTSVINGIGDLVSKSLVTLDRETASRWYLLETTRVYGREKLEDSDEARQAARRHAEFCLTLIAPFGTEGQLQAALDDLQRYRVEVDNLRAALNWAFSSTGDAALGVGIAAAATDFWTAASLVPEACEWAAKALARIGDAAGTRREMVLRYSFGTSLLLTRGMDDRTREALTRALTLARGLADFDYQQRATYYLWLFCFRASALDDAHALARQFAEVAGFGDAQSRAVVDFWLGLTQVYRGAHREAIERVRRAVDQYPAESRRRDMTRFAFGLSPTSASQIAISLLSRGLLDTAARLSVEAIEQARGTNSPVMLCVNLAWAAGFVFPSLGELELAFCYGDELIDHASRHALGPFIALGLCVHGGVAIERGDPDGGIGLLQRGLTGLRDASYLLYYPCFQVRRSAALGAIGRIVEGLAEIDAALRFAAETGNRLFVPETWRVKGQLLALRDPGDPAVEDCFYRGAEVAREQDALFWELRSAASLARLRLTQGRHSEARQILAPVYDRFTEGFGTADLLAARAMLDDIPE
jgi:non-specific serine/threonine protein kinase